MSLNGVHAISKFASRKMGQGCVNRVQYPVIYMWLINIIKQVYPHYQIRTCQLKIR